MKRRKLITIYELIRKAGREPGGSRNAPVYPPLSLLDLVREKPRRQSKPEPWRQLAVLDVPGAVEITRSKARELQARFVVTGNVPTGTVKAYLMGKE